MAQVVDFECVSTSGLESSPVAPGRFKFARQRSKLAGGDPRVVLRDQEGVRVSGPTA